MRQDENIYNVTEIYIDLTHLTGVPVLEAEWTLGKFCTLESMIPVGTVTRVHDTMIHAAMIWQRVLYSGL